MTKENSSNSMPNVSLSDEVKGMIISYVKACNAGDYAKADKLLHLIRKHNEGNS